MNLFKLGDAVTLKAAGKQYDLVGTEDTGRHYYISRRAAHVGDGMWVKADEVEARLESCPGERSLKPSWRPN
jgi:hypothetical protein